MLLGITNTCHMGCPHCFQCSTDAPQHMDQKTFEMAFNFIKWSGAKIILVSGGEPTTHPKWKDVVSRFLADKSFFSVILLSNGSWLGDGTGTEKEIVNLLEEHDNFHVQISSINGIYKSHERTVKEVRRFFGSDGRTGTGIKRRVSFETGPLHMIELGRAKDNEEVVKAARSDPASTSSCFASALVSAQTEFRNAISILEIRGKFCHPLIDWKGNLHWSESWTCPSFASVFESFEEIGRKAHEWRPCGKCDGYRKLKERKELAYVMARQILGI